VHEKHINYHYVVYACARVSRGCGQELPSQRLLQLRASDLVQTVCNIKLFVIVALFSVIAVLLREPIGPAKTYDDW